LRAVGLVGAGRQDSAAGGSASPPRRYDRAADVRLLLPLLLPQIDETAYLLGIGFSITSSARASNVDGTARPSAAAVSRLITSSKLRLLRAQPQRPRCRRTAEHTEKIAPPHAVPPPGAQIARGRLFFAGQIAARPPRRDPAAARRDWRPAARTRDGANRHRIAAGRDRGDGEAQGLAAHTTQGGRTIAATGRDRL